MSDSVNQRIKSISCTARSITTADIRHARRKRTNPGDADREDVLARDRLLDGGDCGVEALDMPHHQRHAGARRSGDDLTPLLDRGRDRLLDENVDVAGDAGERNLVMQMRWRRDGHRIDAFGDQFVQRCEGPAARQFRGACAMRRHRIDHPDQRRSSNPASTRGMIAAHHACTNHPQRANALFASAFTSDADTLELIPPNLGNISVTNAPGAHS